MRVRGIWGCWKVLLLIWIVIPQMCSDCESSLSICTFLYIYYASIWKKEKKTKSKVNITSNGTNQHHVPDDNTGSFLQHSYEKFVPWVSSWGNAWQTQLRDILLPNWSVLSNHVNVMKDEDRPRNVQRKGD